MSWHLNGSLRNRKKKIEGNNKWTYKVRSAKKEFKMISRGPDKKECCKNMNEGSVKRWLH